VQLFSGTSEQFIDKAATNEIAATLEANFRRYMGYRPGKSEVHSWLISLKDLAFSLTRADLNDAGVIVEYKLPMTSKRLDAMLLGASDNGTERGVIVELKQWQAAYKCGIEDCVVFDRHDRTRIHPHPSRQAGQYAEYLRGAHTAFYSDDGGPYVDLSAVSFCHEANSRKCGDLLDDEFGATLAAYPLFTGDTREGLEELLRTRVGFGDGREVLKRVLESRYAPSKKLLSHVAEMVAGNPVFALLDEQLVAKNIVVSEIKKLERSASKAVVLVEGGPGTGKSVIAVQLLAELATMGRNIVHATGSKAFTTNLRAQVGRKASAVFKYFNSFVDSPPDSIDVIIADEAHRIRESSNTRFSKRSTKPQVNEMLDAAKVCVFLLDDNQVVRPGEVGTPDLIRQAAIDTDAEFFEIKLEGQFRCSGSESYLAWLDWLLDLGGDNDTSWRAKDEDGRPQYDFQIVASPEALEAKLQARRKEGFDARMAAGFCWPWSDPESDGLLVEDVEIDGWSRPWNRKQPGRGGLPPEKDPYTIWATQEEGFGQVGCIYSAQGFEFDYFGVIVGEDLVWDAGERGWRAQKEHSYDSVVKKSPDLIRNLLNTYRVLLSRGMKGTYVCFVHEGTKRRVKEALGQ
jgi:hypothetical protein